MMAPVSAWFAVAWSDEIPAGGVEPLLVDGREYALYRDEEGAPHALDAHCRHLGAHLGYGGAVEGRALRCPFHGWRWEPDGGCSDVPYSKRVPQAARIGAWPVAERNGIVLLWTGAAAPDHEIPHWDFESEGDLRYRARARGALTALASRCEASATASFGPGSVLLGPRVGIYLTPIAGAEVDARLSVRARSEDDAAALLAELRGALAQDAAA
jgi:nitrite reductase/ring-hydroxylating ferredoxin subunit